MEKSGINDQVEIATAWCYDSDETVELPNWKKPILEDFNSCFMAVVFQKQHRKYFVRWTKPLTDCFGWILVFASCEINGWISCGRRPEKSQFMKHCSSVIKDDTFFFVMDEGMKYWQTWMIWLATQNMMANYLALVAGGSPAVAHCRIQGCIFKANKVNILINAQGVY